MMKAKRIIRPREAWTRLGCGHSKFYADYVGKGLIRLFPLGSKSVGILESDLDELIEKLAAGKRSSDKTIKGGTQ